MKKYIIILAIFLAGINFASASWLDDFFNFFKPRQTTTLGVGVFQPFQGGTGINTIPTYGKMLVGNSSGTYTLTATSSLGISGGAGTIDGSGSANTLTYWTDADTIAATSSPTVGYLTATSTTATSTFNGPINETSALNIATSSVYVTGMGLYQPTGESMDYPNETIITTFQSGHGWTKTYGGGTFSDDTSDFIIGTQSVKMNATASTNMRKTGLTPIDLRNKDIRFFIKADIAPNVNGISFYASSDNFTNYIRCDFWNLFTGSNTSGVWLPITLSISSPPTLPSCVQVGSPNLSAITSFQFDVNPGAEVNINVNKLSYFDKPNEGIVSLTFDDGWLTAYNAGMRYMSKYNLRGTAYIIPSYIGTNANYMTLSQLKELQDVHGWDISAHFDTTLTSVSTSTAEGFLLGTKNWLLKNGFQKGADHFAYPGGAYNEHTVLPLVKKYFKSARTIREYTETLPPYDPYRLRIYNITETDATSTVQTAIESAKQNKEWLILMFHSIKDTVSSPSTEIQTLKFQAIIDTINSSGIQVKPISEVINQTNPNLLEVQNGNIGIGTTTKPYSKLSVWGSGTGTNRLFELTNNASTTLMSMLEDGTGYFLGKIGIGTANPTSNLTISQSSSGLLPTLRLENTGAFSGATPNIDFVNTAGNLTHARIESFPGTSYANSVLKFSVANSSKTLQERMRIDVSGNVGIGTTSPYAKLSVVGEAVAQMFTATSTTATSTFAGGLNFENGNFIYDYSTNRVGIGTAAPVGKLHILGTDAVSASLIFERQSSDIYGPYIQFKKTHASGAAAAVSDYLGGETWLVGNGATFGAGSAIWSYAANVTAGQESAGIDFLTTTDGTITGLRSSDIKVRITNTGNLGIGTTSPYAKLSVAGIGSFDDFVRASYFTATSTSLYSTFPYADITTSLKIPRGTAPTINAQGQLALDTTSNNLILATSTTGHIVVSGATTTLYAFDLASTSPRLSNGGIQPMPAHWLPQVVTAVICKANAGTSVVINLSDGTNDTNTVTCTTTETQYAITSNNSWTAYETIRMEVGVVTGAVDSVTTRFIGYRTTD